MWNFSHASFLRVLFLAILLGRVDSIFLKVTGVNCTSRNESIYKFKTCHLKPVKRGVQELSVYLINQVVSVKTVKVTLFVKRRNDHQNRPIFEYHVDACAFLRNKRRNPLAELFYNYLGFNTHSNMNHTCPYNHDVYIDRFPFSSHVPGPLPVPAGSYGIYTHWALNGVKEVDFIVFLEAFDRSV